MLDVLFVTPNNSQNIYQELSNKYSAIETPTWSLLLAESCRKKGFKVGILDTLAENISDENAFVKINELKPRLICFVVYGQNVNSGTTSMSGATRLANFLKKKNKDFIISFVGSHVQALPKKTLEEELSIDFVFMNEGVYAILNVLQLKNINEKNLENIKGIALRTEDNKILITEPETTVPTAKMDHDLPGYAWDLLPYKKNIFDLYRAPMWHAEYSNDNRSPYVAIQTSLGCQFKCTFCMINLINRDNSNEVGVANQFNKMRFWSTDFVFKQFEKLYKLGVRTIKITDEMFLLNPKYYKPLCEKLSILNKKDDLRIWAYSRIDTIKKTETLKLLRKAGIKWLALGIESANKNVRLEVSKGKFEDVDVEKVISEVHKADIEVIANYIYGLPGDDEKSLEQTFKLSQKLCTLGWNTYPAMALPGSQLYKEAIDNGIKLPDSYEGFSFHSYNAQPLSSNKLSAAKILKLRDRDYIRYHTYKPFLERVKEKFGEIAVLNIKEMSKIHLKRKLVEEEEKENS